MWIQHKNKKNGEKVGEWSNKNHPSHLRVMDWRYQLTEIRGKPKIPRSTEERNLEINQTQIPKPRPNSRDGALTRKAILLTLGLEHPKNSPEQWRNWINNLEQHIVTASRYPSWLKLQPPPPNQVCLPTLIWSPSAQKHMQRWLTPIKRTHMKPSTKIWGRRISMNQKCTRSTFLLWAKPMNNHKIRQSRTPPSIR